MEGSLGRNQFNRILLRLHLLKQGADTSEFTKRIREREKSMGGLV